MKTMMIGADRCGVATSSLRCVCAVTRIWLLYVYLIFRLQVWQLYETLNIFFSSIAREDKKIFSALILTDATFNFFSAYVIAERGRRKRIPMSGSSRWPGTD